MSATGYFAKLEADYVVLAQHLDDQAETVAAAIVARRGCERAGRHACRQELDVQDESARATKQREGFRTGRGLTRRYCGQYWKYRGARSRNMRRENALQWITDESNDESLLTGISCVMNFFPCWKSVFLPIARLFCGDKQTYGGGIGPAGRIGRGRQQGVLRFRKNSNRVICGNWAFLAQRTCCAIRWRSRARYCPAPQSWRKFCVNCYPQVRMQKCMWFSGIPKSAASRGLL